MKNKTLVIILSIVALIVVIAVVAQSNKNNQTVDDANMFDESANDEFDIRDDINNDTNLDGTPLVDGDVTPVVDPIAPTEPVNPTLPQTGFGEK